jgi:Mpv17 / PMP22 family
MIGLYRSTLVSGTNPIISRAGTRIIHNTKNRLKTTTDDVTKKNIKNVEVPSSSVGDATTSTIVEGGNGTSFAKENPFIFQLIVATLKTVAADLTTQIVAEGKSWNEVDWKRSGIFVVFGFTYLGGFQYWLMVHKYRQWFPTMDKFAKMSFNDKLKYHAGIIDAGKMVIFDIFIHLPLMYFPSYYAVKEFVAGTTWNPKDWIIDGVTKYRNNMQEDLSAMVKVWVPSDCIQFVLPVHMRMPFRHMVSFFWTAYVSFTRGAITKKE